MAGPRADDEVRGRRRYLDWLRGLAVLVMIEAHVLDSWTRSPDRESFPYALSMIVGGLGAPLFLFLAGVSVSLSAGGRLRTSGSQRAAARPVMWRGLEIFALAFVFRLQAMIVSWGTWTSLLKVDILNIMGPSILIAAATWAAARSVGGRLVACALGAVAVSVLTPPVRVMDVLHALPDPIEAYLRPRAGLTHFAIFPWTGFVLAGAAAGVLIEAARTQARERAANGWIAGAGVAVAALAYAGSFLPSVLPNSQFWTSSPSFFLLRTGVLAAALGGAYLWDRRPWGTNRWSPLQQLGRTSLFIYWIHIELIYGLIVRPLHKSLSLGEAWLGVAVFALVMLSASVAKERLSSRFSRHARPPKGEGSRSQPVL